jgi:hypothetical protein
MNFCKRSLLAAAISVALLPCASRGTTFNWPTTPAFPAGPTAGNSVLAVYGGLGAVSITNVADGTHGGGAWTSGYPKVEQNGGTGGDPTGGLTNTPGLELYVASQPTVNSYMKVVISFGYTGGATNVSLNLWDVDSASNFTDKIANIVGVTANGTLVPLTVTGSADNSVTGSGTVNATAIGTATSPNNSNTGNVTISSGTVPIQEITFSYYDSNTTTRTTQIIGISPITFTPIGSATPEVGSAMGSLLLCGAVVGVGALRRRKNRVCA